MKKTMRLDELIHELGRVRTEKELAGLREWLKEEPDAIVEVEEVEEGDHE